MKKKDSIANPKVQDKGFFIVAAAAAAVLLTAADLTVT